MHQIKSDKELDQLALKLDRLCRICRSPLPKGKLKYCKPDCYREGQRVLIDKWEAEHQQERKEWRAKYYQEHREYKLLRFQLVYWRSKKYILMVQARRRKSRAEGKDKKG